jgi:hypothetical protein
MTNVVCNYAILRFLPYRETGEFVNVGVVLYCPQAGYYSFLSELRRRGRVNGFFPELEPTIFRDGLRSMRGELNRVQKILGDGRVVRDPELATFLIRFRELVRSREGVFHFGGHGTLLAPDPAKALEQLYQQFVLRQFAQHPEYHETVMRKRLDDWLRQWNLRRFYKVNRPVGDERFHITFPFVQTVHRNAHKAIKPLDLDRRDATDVYLHAAIWLDAVRRLNKTGGAIPKNLIFPVHMPASGEKRSAAEEVKKDFQTAGATVVEIDDEFELRRAVEPELLQAG